MSTMRQFSLISLFGFAFVWSCGSEGPPSSYVLLDRDARQAGFGLQLASTNWRGSPALPISIIDPDAEHVSLSGPRGRTALSVFTGELGLVRGSSGRVEHLTLGTDIPDDELWIDGTAEGANALRELVGGKLEQEGSERFVLRQQGIFELVSFLDPPDGIDAVLPALPGVDQAPAISFGEVVDANWTPGMRRMSDFAGIYHSGASYLVLDTSGRFTISYCSDEPQRGRYHVEGETLTLMPDEGEARVMMLEESYLADGNGDLFYLMTAVLQ